MQQVSQTNQIVLEGRQTAPRTNQLASKLLAVHRLCLGLCLLLHLSNGIGLQLHSAGQQEARQERVLDEGHLPTNAVSETLELDQVLGRVPFELQCFPMIRLCCYKKFVSIYKRSLKNNEIIWMGENLKNEKYKTIRRKKQMKTPRLTTRC